MLVLAAVFYTSSCISTSPAILRLPARWGCCFGLTLPENFKTPFLPPTFPASGAAGTSAFRPGCRTISLCRWRGPMFPGRDTRQADPPARRGLRIHGVFCVGLLARQYAALCGVGPFCRPATAWVRAAAPPPRQAQRRPPARVQWAARRRCLRWCVSMVFSGWGPPAAAADRGRCVRIWAAVSLTGHPRGFAASCTPPRPAALRQRHHGGRVLRLHGAGAGAGVYLGARRAFAFKNKARRDLPCQRKKHRWAIYYALVIALLIGYIMQSGGFGSSGFGMYAGF